MTDTDRAPVLRARGLYKKYGKDAGLVRAVDGVDLDVAPGETVAVTGPSGCGKSTLLHLAGGLDRPTSGELWLAGKRIDTMSERALARLRRNAIGFVFQAFHLSAAQALPALPGAIIGIPAGIALFAVANSGGVTTIPPVSWLLAAVLVALVAVAGLTTIPARLATRHPPGEILRSETG